MNKFTNLNQDNQNRKTFITSKQQNLSNNNENTKQDQSYDQQIDYNQNYYQQSQKQAENQKIEKVEQELISKPTQMIPPPPPPPIIPEGMTDPKEIEEFIKKHIDDHFTKFFESISNNQNQPTDQEVEKYNNEIEGEFINNLHSENNNYTGFGKWEIVEKLSQSNEPSNNEYDQEEGDQADEKKDKDDNWMKMEKFEEDAEEDVEEQYDPHAKLNLPDDSDDDSDSSEKETKKKDIPVLFKSKRNFQSRNKNQTKKIKLEDN